MNHGSAPFLTAAVEGITDEAAVRRLAGTCGLTLSRVHVKRDKHQLDKQLSGYNAAASALRSPWLVLRDLDHDAGCAPELRSKLIPGRSEHLLLRIPVRSLESWLLADRANLASFLSVPRSKLPQRPERLKRPKRTLVDLARRSKRGVIRRDMVPDEGISAEVGAGYSTRLIEFIETVWDPREAAENANSLARCLRALQQLPGRA